MRALEQINFQKLYLLCKNFAENSCHQMLARRTCFAAKQAFESEYAIAETSGADAAQGPVCLHLQGLGKTFPAAHGKQALCVLHDVNFRIYSGEFVALLGRSGCGKSTLLAVLAGLEKATQGAALMHGKAISGPGRERMLMFQDAALFPWLNVLDNVLYGLKLVPGLSTAGQRQKAEEHLCRVGLQDFRHYRVHQLSGGMRQRLALARALAPEPQVLLMDEPFSALDAITREQLYEDMQHIWQQSGTTVLMVTHNAREAVCLGTRVLVMGSEGRLLCDEPVDLPFTRSMNDPQLAAKAGHIAAFLHEVGPC